MSPPNTLERFETLIGRDGPNGCWLWRGYRQSAGYGAYRVNGKKQLAHRLAYTLYVGAIPDGLEIDHLCRNKLCVNPAHLEAVTHRENTVRGTGIASRARATHCVRGHEFDERNTHHNANGTRQCKTCQREWRVRNADRLRGLERDRYRRERAPHLLGKPSRNRKYRERTG